MSKKVFHRLGNHIINQYEVRRVEIMKPKLCPKGCRPISRATVHFKDGSRILVTSNQVPLFLAQLMSETA